MKKALVLSLAAVLGLGFASFAQTLSGSWDTTIGVQPGPPVVLTIDSELIVTYAVSGWTFSSDTVLDETGWVSQHFDVAGALGAFTIGSVLTFNPTAPSFTSWKVMGGLSIAGVTFDGTFTLLPGDLSLKIVGAGTAGNVDVAITLLLGQTAGGCDFNFNGVTIEVDFPFCCADVISKINFTCAGFQYVTFEVKDIALPGITWATLDAKLTFDLLTGKQLVITPNFDFGGTACFDIYLTDPEGGMLFGDIAVIGLGIQCEIGGVSFTGLSWLDEGTAPADKPGILKGTTYWEAYQIATTDDGCCGPFNFDVTVFFNHGALLFDVAELDANMSIQISTQFTFTSGINIVLAPASFNLTFGFLVEW